MNDISFKDATKFFHWCFLIQIGQFEWEEKTKHDFVFLIDKDKWLDTSDLDNVREVSWEDMYRIYLKEMLVKKKG